MPNVNVPCLWHEETEGSLGVDLDLDTFYCFGCEKSGRPSRYPELVALALEYESKYASMGWSGSSQAVQELPKHLDGRDHSSNAYLMNRGFTNAILDKFEVSSDDYAIYFPVILRDGTTQGYIRRVWENTSNRYRNSKGFRRKFYLYGSWLCDAKENVVIVEGPLDCIKLHQLGMTNVVATMGTRVSDEQLTLVTKLSRKVILAFDNDGPGFKAKFGGTDDDNRQKVREGIATRLIKLGVEVSALVYPGHDPAELEDLDQVHEVNLLESISIRY